MLNSARHARTRPPGKRRSDPSTQKSFSRVFEELSSALARSPYDRIEREVEYWLEAIGRSLGIDRSVIAEFLPGRGFQVVHQWTREGFPPMPMVLAEEIIPWAAALVRSGQTVVVSSVRSLPRDAEEDRKFMLSSEFSPKASILTPLVIDDRVIGAITFGDCKRSRRWPKELVRRLELVANIFGNAIARQRAALEANQLREAAAQASRAALAGEMAASITHELNHPLGAILANAQTARRMLEGPHPDLSELRQIMDDIIAGERRATHYMERVRHVHRNDRLQVEPLEVHSILNIVGNLVRASLLANRISLVIDVEPGLPRMAADRIATEQALLNLVRNGIEALTEAQPSPRTITIRGFRRDSGLVAISVADTGGGIPSTHLERIFEPFFTTREQGTGMGLAIVRSIVESQGGSIAVQGGSGTGAVFEFTVPEWQEIEEIG